MGCGNKESFPPPVGFEYTESLPPPVGCENKESFSSPVGLLHSESLSPLEGHTEEDNPRERLKLLWVFVQEPLWVTEFEKCY